MYSRRSVPLNGRITDNDELLWIRKEGFMTSFIEHFYLLSDLSKTRKTCHSRRHPGRDTKPNYFGDLSSGSKYFMNTT
jgi:hypothetical protein